MSVVKGKAKRFNGTPIDYVLLFDWVTGARLGKSVPDNLGNWRFYFQSNLKCGITYVADGCEPISHGAYDLAHTVLPEFVDYIGSVNSLDEGSSSETRTIITTIPSTVQVGDILVLAVARRASVTVVDSNSGAWTLGADSFDFSKYTQATSIYYRTAIAGDAGAVISTTAVNSGVLISYLSIYRGKYKPLKVSATISNPVRYDETYSRDPINLAPISHDGGFIVRAVSNAYVLSNYDNAKMIISGMTPTGAISGHPLRMQVAYKHLETADILRGITYSYGGSGNSNAVYPDAAIILNEV